MRGRGLEHLPGLSTELQLVRRASLVGQRHDQAAGFGLQAAIDRLLGVGLEEVVLRTFQQRAQQSNRLAIPLFVDHLFGHLQATFGRAVRWQKHAVGRQLVVCPLARGQVASNPGHAHSLGDLARWDLWRTGGCGRGRCGRGRCGRGHCGRRRLCRGERQRPIPNRQSQTQKPSGRYGCEHVRSLHGCLPHRCACAALFAAKSVRRPSLSRGSSGQATTQGRRGVGRRPIRRPVQSTVIVYLNARGPCSQVLARV